MKKPFKFKPIPPFTSYAEEATFWDTHSVADDWDKRKLVKVMYAPEGKKAKNPKLPHDTVIHIKINAKMKQLLDQKAKAQASTISALLRLWVQQKLAESARSLSSDR
jgi:hypothetical protein